MLKNKFYLFCLFFVLWSPYASADQKYHKAETNAEKKLDNILYLNDSESAESENFHEFIYNMPRYHGNYWFFSNFFTKNFLNSVALTEGKMVAENCGYYRENDLCGLNYSVISCAQDYSENGYIYKAVLREKRKEIFLSRWNRHSVPSDRPVRYRMVKQGVQWKLDAVDCGRGWNNF